MTTHSTPFGLEVSDPRQEDRLAGVAIFAALAALIFAFPWLIVAVSHFAGNF